MRSCRLPQKTPLSSTEGDLPVKIRQAYGGWSFGAPQRMHSGDTVTYTPFNPWQNAPFGPNPQTELNALRMQQQALFQQQQRELQQSQNKTQALYMAQELGRLIAQRRTSLGLSYKQLASLSGVSQDEVIQIEAGNISPVSDAFTAFPGMTNAISMEKYLIVMAALRLHLSAYPV